jgi:pimeloyl-ACP methyl ester carboxylesterase
VIVLALALVAVACGSGTESETGTDRYGGRLFRHTPGSDVAAVASGSTGGGPAATVPPYDISLRAINCPFDRDSANRMKVDCYNLIVPMRRDQPTGAKVYLAVARIHATAPTPLPDPVVYLDGGPGGSAITSIDRWTAPVSPLLANRDVILVDQRGTGYSQPRLNCDRAFLTSPKGEFDDRRDEAAKCLVDLRAEKIEPNAFNSTESAADVADLRTALKAPAINLFGISYGTRLALWTMATHPEGIRSVVLDSTYPPGSAKLYEETATNLNRAIEALFADCNAQPACRSRYPDLRGTLYATIDRLDAQPLRYRRYDAVQKKYVTTPYTGGDYLMALFSALYVTEVMPDIPKAIYLGGSGNISDAVDLFAGQGALDRSEEDDLKKRPPGARTRPSFTDGLNYSVECAESAPGITGESVDAAAAGLAPEIGRAVATMRKRQLEVCSVWDVSPKPLTEVTSAIPTLVLAGTYDPITPPSWGEHAANLLPNSRLATVIGSGHAVYYAGDCPKQLVKQFIDDPAAPSPDCTGAAPDFIR